MPTRSIASGKRWWIVASSSTQSTEVPDEAVEALARVLLFCSRGTYWSQVDPATKETYMRVAESELRDHLPQLVNALLKQGAEEERKRATNQIKALRVYNDEEIAAKRGAMEGWVRIDDVLIALDNQESQGTGGAK